MNLLIFDSGIGGLGVVGEIRKLRPQAGMTYLADNGFYPYGEKPDGILIGRILEIVGKAIAHTRPDAVVIACNTASTVALGHLRERFPLPFIGCVPPIKPAAAASRSRHIGLLATAATIRRPYLAELQRNYAGDCVVHSLGTPILADLAEQKFRGARLQPSELADAIAPLFAQPEAERIDAVALGCTHYSFLLPELLQLRPALQWFDPAHPVARQTASVTDGLAASAASGYADIAFCTAPPPDAQILQTGLAGYGFGQLRLLPDGSP